MPLPKDPIKAEETHRKMSEAREGHAVSEKTRRKISESEKGKRISEETRRKLSTANIGKKQSPETIAKTVAANTGQLRAPRIKKNCAFCGKEMILLETEKSRKFCSMDCKGKWQSENAVEEKGAHWRGGDIIKKCEECGKEFSVEKNRKEKARFCSSACHGKWNSKNLIGANHPSWPGGPKEYCEKWTSEFRHRIRAFFDYKCAECGTPQTKKLLHCHHVYYDKKACCSVNEDGKYFSNLGIKGNPHSFEIIGDPNKFIALCDRCHKSTSGKKNREFWAQHFEEIINNYYLGRSYFTQEEYDKIR